MKCTHLGRVGNTSYLKSKHYDLAIGKVLYSEILGGCTLTS